MQHMISARSLAEVESKPRLGLRRFWLEEMLRDFWNQRGSAGLGEKEAAINHSERLLSVIH